jgi:hypothetical protein
VISVGDEVRKIEQHTTGGRGGSHWEFLLSARTLRREKRALRPLIINFGAAKARLLIYVPDVMGRSQMI